MQQISFSPSLNKISILYSIPLQNNPIVDLTQFAVVNSPTPLFIVAGSVLNNTLTLELSSSTVPTGNFGVTYIPNATNPLKAQSGTNLGRIYYPVEVLSTNSSCPGGNCTGTDPVPLEPLQVVSVTCLDNNTVEVLFSKYLSSNFVPAITTFTILDLPTGTLGAITQVSISGKRVLLEHTHDAPLNGTVLEYLPPSIGYLRTNSSPELLVLPFQVPIACGGNTITDCEASGGQVHKNGVSTPIGTRLGTLATINDYVLIYGMQEAVQASNDGDGSATTINSLRLQAELDHAGVMLQNYIDISGYSGKSLLAGSFLRTQLVIARYYLLNKSRPEVVREEFEKTLQWIESTAYSNVHKADPSCDNGQFSVVGANGTLNNSTGRVLTSISAQQYRVDDGLGLRGFFLPSEEDNLWRVQSGYQVPDYLKRRARK